MKHILFAVLAGLFLPLSAEMLGNRPFQSENDLKGIYNLDRKTMRIRKLEEGGSALEIQVPESFREAKNLIAIHLPGERIRNTRLSVSRGDQMRYGQSGFPLGGRAVRGLGPGSQGKERGMGAPVCGGGKERMENIPDGT